MKKKSLYLLIIFCCVFAVIASFAASEFPDGLEWTAEKLGFLEIGESFTALNSPFPDYAIPFIKNKYVSGALAGVLGTLIVYGILIIIGKLFAKKHKS